MTQDNRKWYIIDAKDKILGRLSTQIAAVLYGKNKVDFAPHIDNGDWVVVINAKQVKVTGNKVEDKKYYRHSGYPGGLKTASYREIMEKNPEKIIMHAVKGMLPKNKIGVEALKRLRVFSDENHNITKELTNI
ncbi:50S ribosomal protein L13 [bacterium]|nr:50S ribosomal protein L13 [bacterium]